MASVYKKLFNVALRHDFYLDGLTRDFDIVPASLTQKILKDNKLFFKIDNLGFRIMYRAESEASVNSFIDFSNLELRFGMILKNVAPFINVTDLKNGSESFERGNIMYFTNTAITTHQLTYAILDQLKPNQFTYEFPQDATGSGDLASIQILDELSNDVTPPSPPGPPFTNIVPDTNNKYHYMVDLSNQPPGLYTFITTSNGGVTVETRDIYIDNNMVKAGVNGIIKIKAVDAQNASYPPDNLPTDPARQYFTNFVRRSTKWRYIVVPKLSSITAAEIEVQDSATDPLPYNPLGLYDFDPVTMVPPLEIDGVEAAVWESDDLIPFFERPKKHLQVFNTTSSEVVLENITNPARNVISALKTNLVTDFDTTLIYVIV